MSLTEEFQFTGKYFGPKPKYPSVSVLVGIGIAQDGSMGAQMLHQSTGEIELISELGLYRDLDIYLTEIAKPNIDLDYKNVLENQAEILHYSLSSLQKNLIKKGCKLEMPLTSHPQIDMELPKLSEVPYPKIEQ